MAPQLVKYILGLIVFSATLLSCANLPSKKDLYLLKKLLLYRMAESKSVPPSPPTLQTSVTTTELSIFVAKTNGSAIMDDLYNTIFIGNGSTEIKMRDIFTQSIPTFRALGSKSVDKLTRQRALVELAIKIQPLIAPLTANHPNLTAKVTALGAALDFNRTGRGGGYGGWGWGGWGGWGGGGGGGGGGGWGESCCCCGWGGGKGNNGNDLLAYLLAQQNGNGNGNLNTLLPLLFGLIALLITKLPT